MGNKEMFVVVTHLCVCGDVTPNFPPWLVLANRIIY